MGFKLALLAYFHEAVPLDLNRPAPDKAVTGPLVGRLYPRTPYEEHGSISLLDGGFPQRGALNVGAFETGVLIATLDAHMYNPSKLHRRYLKSSMGQTAVLLTQRSANDMFAYARWVDGSLKRSISVNPVGKVWENIGSPESFEAPFWNGEHPVEGDYPLPFHPLELSAAAL